MPAKLSINFMPNAIYEPETCLQKTLQAAKKVGFPHHNIIFEVTEHEKVANHELLVDVFRTYRSHGFMNDLGVRVIVESIETVDEFRYLQDKGVELMQEYYFQRPDLERANIPIW